jgi:zinc finger protein BrlA
VPVIHIAYFRGPELVTEAPLGYKQGQSSLLSSDVFPWEYPYEHSRSSPGTNRRPERVSADALDSMADSKPFKCIEAGCKRCFKRRENLTRHLRCHSIVKSHVCWVPGCQRTFKRSDNLKVHYTRTHGQRGGRNRYVATLDRTSSDYDPSFRGQLTFDGRPLHAARSEEVWEAGS